MRDQATSTVGKVYLIGAGPGHPGLITLRGVECLGQADVVLYDYLVNPQILVHARNDAERICLGRHGRGRLWSQAEIIEQLIERAGQGLVVARLKGGDPAVFARGAEELEALASAQIPFEVVPGVTAALAAGSYAGIPVTHRRLASAVALITGQEHADKTDSSLDFDAFAAFPGTLVFYMGVTTADRWTKALIDAGKPATTPAAIIRRCSLPDQEMVRCSLGEVADRLNAPTKMRPPIIVVVGEVVEQASLLSWFDRRPLFGQRILVTRPTGSPDPLAGMLTELGAEVLGQPAIEIQPPADWQSVDDALAGVEDYDWVVFSSANGVRFTFDRLFALGRDTRALGRARLASVGPGTTDELLRYSLVADLEPRESRAESLAEALEGEARGKRFLLPRASRGRDVLARRLEQSGGEVDEIVCYRSVDVAQADSVICGRVERRELDWVTVTSSAIANSLHHLFGSHLADIKLASISPITSQTLRELGLEPEVEANPHTMKGLCEAIVGAVTSSS